jgi:hypothetical protein
MKLGFYAARPFMISTEQGAETSIYLATTDIENLKSKNGYYFAKSKPAMLLNKGVAAKNIELFWTQSKLVVKDFIEN